MRIVFCVALALWIWLSAYILFGQDTLKVKIDVEDSILIRVCFKESILWIIPTEECRTVSRGALYEWVMVNGIADPAPEPEPVPSYPILPKE